MNFGFFLIFLMTSSVLADDVCYKYEPMYNNATGSTALSVVRMTSSDICKLAGQCKVKDQSTVNNVSNSYLMCPLPVSTPSPQPSVETQQFYLAPTSEWQFSVQNQSKNEICPKKEEVFAAMCYVNDDWSNMCPRDQNSTADWLNESLSNSSLSQPVCYVMKRSKINRHGICNVTITPPKEFCDVINGCEKSSQTAANKSLVLFHFDRTGNTCSGAGISPTKFLSAPQATCGVLDQHFTVNLPTCLRPVKHLNETKTPFSLHGMFNTAFQQCVAR